MLPSHCKEVSVKSVSFPLTAENIKEYLRGKKAYIRTRYYIFKSGNDWAVALIVKKLANAILQEIASVHILSLPDDTAFVDDPSVEVLSASSMGALREELGKKCVVVRGKSAHVSFFIDEPPYELTIFDVVPPFPSKLEELVDSALESDLQDRYVRVKVVSMDLNTLAGGVRTKTTMFPCRASGLRAGEDVLFLDETPALSESELGEVTLVGCSLSARIFKAVYGVEANLINMCPQELLAEKKIEGKVLTKCCRVKEGFEIRENVAVVPWGVRPQEVRAALEALLR
jgi:hypothetical protein